MRTLFCPQCGRYEIGIGPGICPVAGCLGVQEHRPARVITVQQPWGVLFFPRAPEFETGDLARLGYSGPKNIENRTWVTKYRGPLWIHSGSGRNKEAIERFRERAYACPSGVILGVVQLTGIAEGHSSPWAIPGCRHWVVERPQMIAPRAIKGRLSLWRLDGDK